ncbi:MAG: DUF4388 domain-containing protein [Myxococcota bacterium]
MAQPLKLGRDIREMSFPVAASKVIRAHATGVLEVHDTLGVSRAYFVNGHPQGGRLARMKHPLGQLIVDEGIISELQLNGALNTQRTSNKLLGQVLLESNIVSEEVLDQLIKKQSQLNFFSLFGVREGRLSFKEGTVHLTNFTPAPVPPTAAVYFGLRDAGRIDGIYGTVAPMLTSGLQLVDGRDDVLENLPPAEQYAVEWLRQPRFAGELARALPLPGDAVTALLFALDANEALQILPARQVPLDQAAL